MRSVDDDARRGDPVGSPVVDPVDDVDRTDAGGRRDAGRVQRLPRRLLRLLVRGWQMVVSPWYPPVCRFYPSCSTYAVHALDEHGAVRGGGLALRRLLRCHPWNPGGVDHVPPREDAPRAGA